MPIEPPEIPPATPGTPKEPPPGIPPGNPNPEVPPPAHEPGMPPRPNELPGENPQEAPQRGPGGPHPPSPTDTGTQMRLHSRSGQYGTFDLKAPPEWAMNKGVPKSLRC